MLLAEELLDLAGPEELSKYAQIAARKSEKVWKKAEKNRALAHNSRMTKPREIGQLFTEKLKLCV